MPKIPYKSKKKYDDDIVSFESFSYDTPKSGSSKDDSLTLNDNINYQLYYEKSKSAGESSGVQDKVESELKETSLSGTSSKHPLNTKAKAESSQGKVYPQNGKYAFLNRMKHSVPKRPDSPNSDSDKGMKYERFSERNTNRTGWCSKLPGVGSGILVLTVVCVLCVVVWWGVWGVLGGAWGEEHYRRLWERAHPHHNHHTHYSPSVIVHQQLERLDPIAPFEPKYHDHNNLSTKNKNASETIKLKNKSDLNDHELKKKEMEPLTDLPSAADDDQCTTVHDDGRFDCFPEGDASEQGCKLRGCCWIPHNQRKANSNHYRVNGLNEESFIGLPYCFYPPQYRSYHFSNITETRHGMMAYLERQFQSAYPDDVNVIAINVKYLSEDSLQVKVPKLNIMLYMIQFLSHTYLLILSFYFLRSTMLRNKDMNHPILKYRHWEDLLLI